MLNTDPQAKRLVTFLKKMVKNFYLDDFRQKMDFLQNKTKCNTVSFIFNFNLFSSLTKNQPFITIFNYGFNRILAAFSKSEFHSITNLLLLLFI